MPHEKVTRLRELLGEARPRATSIALVHPPPTHQRRRRQHDRDIARIMQTYACNSELSRALQAACLPVMETLTDEQVAQLATRLRLVIRAHVRTVQNTHHCPAVAQRGIGK